MAIHHPCPKRDSDSESTVLSLRGFSGRGDEHTIDCRPGRITIIARIPSTSSYRKALCQLKDIERVFLNLGPQSLSKDSAFQVSASFDRIDFDTIGDALAAAIGENCTLDYLETLGVSTQAFVNPAKLTEFDKYKLSILCAFKSDAEVLHFDFEDLDFNGRELKEIAELISGDTLGSERIVVVTGLATVPDSWRHNSLVSIKSSANSSSRLINKTASTEKVQTQTIVKDAVPVVQKGYPRRASTLTKVNKADRLSVFLAYINPKRIFERLSKSDSESILD